MTIREVLKAATARLDAAGVPNGDYDAAVMLAHVMDEDALMLRMNSWKEMPQEKFAQYEAMKRLCSAACGFEGLMMNA